jgi:hypothetical protein
MRMKLKCPPSLKSKKMPMPIGVCNLMINV